MNRRRCPTKNPGPTTTRAGTMAGLVAICCVAVLLQATPARAWDGVVQLTLGGVKQVVYRGAILRLSVGSPEVAEISPLGGSDILIKGKQIGSTTLMVWGRDGGQSSYLIQVGVDTESLAANLKELFASEGVTLQSAGETLMLRGTVSSLEAMQSIADWAEGYKLSLGNAGTRLKIINRLELAGSQQVQLEVRFAEVSRSAMRKLGLSLRGQYGGHDFGISGPGKIPAIESDSSTGVLAPPLTNAMQVLFVSDPKGTFPFTSMLSVLSSRGVARTLSEPTLVALSGQQASFLVGGEFPVGIPLGLGQVSLEWKKFGVQLDFQPFVLQDQTVQLKVASTVSDLDWSNSFSLGGNTVPSLTSRFSSTTVRLRSGQSFAIAGLLSDKVRNVVDKVPVLGDIPVIGMLFRSTQFQRDETELVVVVTARLVQPLAATEMPALPGEGETNDPNDFELFLMGWLDGLQQEKSNTRPASRPSGRVGYRR